MSKVKATETDDKSAKLDKLAAEFLPTEEDIKEVKEAGDEQVKNAVFSWEEALATYDPTFRNYTPSADAFEFFNLMRLVAGEDFETDNSIAQYFMVDVLLDNITNDMYPYSQEVNESITIDNERVGICCSRGLAKSTLITNFIPIYVAITGELPKYGQQRCWVLLGASQRGHARSMAISMRAVCEESKYFNDVMESYRFTETEFECVRKGPGSERSRYFYIRFSGIFTPIRGIKNKYNDRPDLALMDDCMPSQAASYSKVITGNYATALYSDIGNALVARNGRIWNIFTPFNYQEPNSASLLNGSFTPVLIPVAKAFDNPDAVKQTEIVSSWPQMHTKGSIHKMWRLAKSSKSLSLFMQERMLNLSTGTDRLVQDDEIQWTDMKLIGNNIGAYTVLITTDYTTTSGEKSDFSGVATWAISNNDDWFLLNVSLRKRTIPEQYTATLDEAARWKRKGKYVELGIEIDGGQGSHVYGLEQMMAKRADWYSFAKDINDAKGSRKGILSRGSRVKKHERFRMIVPRFQQKKIWFPEHQKNDPDMIELVSQIKGATHESFTRADDGPDLLSQVGLIKYTLPTVEAISGVAKKHAGDAGYDPFWDDDTDDDRHIPANAGYL